MHAPPWNQASPLTSSLTGSPEITACMCTISVANVDRGLWAPSDNHRRLWLCSHACQSKGSPPPSSFSAPCTPSPAFSWQLIGTLTNLMVKHTHTLSSPVAFSTIALLHPHPLNCRLGTRHTQHLRPHIIRDMHAPPRPQHQKNPELTLTAEHGTASYQPTLHTTLDNQQNLNLRKQP